MDRLSWVDSGPTLDGIRPVVLQADDRILDEYFGDLMTPVNPDSYYFAVRFSVDGGQSWTNCDSDDDYQGINSGVLEVRPQACVVDDDCAVPEDQLCSDLHRDSGMHPILRRAGVLIREVKMSPTPVRILGPARNSLISTVRKVEFHSNPLWLWLCESKLEIVCRR